MQAERVQLTARETAGSFVRTSLNLRGTQDENGSVFHWVIIALIGFYFVAGSWLFGGVVLWTRLILFWMAVVIFLLAVAPVKDRRTRDGALNRSRKAFVTLLRFPVFWIGLLLFGYVGLQWSNPAWTYTEIGGRWWISNVGLKPNLDWPTSVYAPIERGNPGSFLLRFVGVWLVICAGWIVIRRRKELLTVLIIFAVNSFLVALVAVIQAIDLPSKVLWVYPWPRPDFAGPFFYRNHGGAFFYLAAAISFGLALYFQRKWEPSQTRSSPTIVFAVFGLMNSGAVAASGSRAGWVFGTAILLCYAVLSTGIWLRRSQWRTSSFSGIIVGLLVSILIVSIVAAQNQETLERHFRRLLNVPAELEYSGRTIGNDASIVMFQDVPIFGYGADSYGHVFSLYIDQFPELVRQNRRTGGIRTSWVQAHNDPLQMAVELGIVGASIISLFLLYYLVMFLAKISWFREETILWSVAVLVLFLHSFADLIFQSTILLALFALLPATVLLSLRFEKQEQVSLQGPKSSTGKLTPRTP
ncbi:MAG: O-antigen ligase family protein [Verrucomicrobiota bacterium]